MLSLDIDNAPFELLGSLPQFFELLFERLQGVGVDLGGPSRGGRVTHDQDRDRPDPEANAIPLETPFLK